MKKLRTIFALLAVCVCSLQTAWAQDESVVSVTVTLPEPNSLSTEILKKVEDVKTVTELIVESGTLGEKDWVTLQSMVALKTLNLKNANAEAIPGSQFSGSNEKCPNLETVYLPSNLKSIGEWAFYNKEKLKTVSVPTTIESIGNYAFQGCDLLETCDLSACNKITDIPNSCFYYCKKLQPFEIPSGVKSIGREAFEYCHVFYSNLPSSIQTIGNNAFAYSGMTNLDITIPEGMTVEGGIFRDSGIKSITLPTNCYQFGDFIQWCENITDITLKSPTVLIADASYGYGPSNRKNISLHVPSHLLDLYKTHTYWSTFKEVVAITDPIPSYDVQADLELNYSMRISGTPSLRFILPNYSSLLFKITGETEQTFNDFSVASNMYYNSYDSRYYTMIWSECPSVSISGDFTQRVYFDDKSWRFMCLPFDFKVGDIAVNQGQIAIRTYDGASRNTQNSATNNWKNLTAEDVIPAGRGFIIQTSQRAWVTFKALKGGANYAFKTSSDELKLPLELNNANAEASAANTGWNMVGNPWMTYYNAHKINYTAPFCYFDSNYNKYETVSIADDDYALSPLQAIFVQCPQGVSTIDFPAAGRQLTKEITDQNGARAKIASDRMLLDIQVSGGEDLHDKTRIVVNPQAKADYEIGLDASKFLSYETQHPQIYSLDAEDTQYAINERPEGNGLVRLGIIFAADGNYTISAIRNAVGQVILTDNETGIKTDLQLNSYSFDAKQGTYEKRFTLAFGSGTTGIQTLTEPESADVEVFNLGGQHAGISTDGLSKGVYVIRKGNKTQKVIIK